MEHGNCSIGVITLAMLCGLPAFAQAPPATAPQTPTVKVTTEEVLLDIIVRDKKGKPVTDIKPEELTVTDNGVRQAVTSFRLVAGSEAISQNGVTAKLDPLRQLRLVTLAFEPLAEIDQRKTARSAAIDLINGEQGASVYYSVVAVDTRLLVLQQFTKDRQALTSAIERATGGYAGPKLMSESDAIIAELRRQLAGQTVNGADQSATLLAEAGQAASQNTLQGKPGSNADFTAPILARVMLDMLRMDQGVAAYGARLSIYALKALVQGLQSIPGRKPVIYFSTGMYETPELDLLFHNLMSQANRANVTFYSVDTRGVMTAAQNLGASRELSAAAAASATTVQRTEGAVTKDEVWAMDRAEASGRANVQLAIRQLAESTGGFLIGDSNDLRGPLRKVNEEISSYYELTFNPHIQNYDGSFHQLAVVADRKDLVIHARSGYFALPPEARAIGLEPYELPLLKAISDGQALTGVKFRSGAVRLQPRSDETELMMLVEVPLHELEAKADPARKTLNIHCSLAALVKDSKGQVVEKLVRDRPLMVTADQLKMGNLVDKMAITLPPGKYTVESAVMDRESGKIGTERSEFTLAPHGKGVGISSITRVRSYTPNVKGLDSNEPFQFQGGSITPTLDTNVPKMQDATLSLFVIVYEDPSTSQKPSLEIEFLKDGQSLTKVPMALPDADSEGRIRFVITIPAAAIPPGSYEVRATARQGDTSAETSVPVSIVAMQE
jgi:VWFA-related protein